MSLIRTEREQRRFFLGADKPLGTLPTMAGAPLWDPMGLENSPPNSSFHHLTLALSLPGKQAQGCGSVTQLLPHIYEVLGLIPSIKSSRHNKDNFKNLSMLVGVTVTDNDYCYL